MRIYLLLAMAAGASLIGSKCGGEGVGDPCVPEDEYLTGFSGFSQSEVNVESRSFQCLTRVCLVNHFQGRVSCPYGQIEDPDAKNKGLATCMGTEAHRLSEDCLPGGQLHRESCQVPDRDGARWSDRIVPPVEPQLKDRQAEATVYCSCRCDGDDKSADYCKCPKGFSCERLVEDLGFGREQLAGSYCIKDESDYDPGLPATEECNPNSPGDHCSDKFSIKFAGNEQMTGTNQRVGSCLPSGAECKGSETCCVNKQIACNDDPNSEERNCNAEGASCGGCPSGPEFGHVDGGLGCCNYASGAQEPIFVVDREANAADCSGGVCP